MNSEARVEEFKKQNTLAKLVKCVKEFGAYHRSYCFYTSLDRVLQMMGSKYHRLWLTRLDAGLFDDGIEHKKYGAGKERSRTYIRSFTYGIQESAAMWGLYCPCTYKAIRVNITQKGMNKLLGCGIYEVKGKDNTDKKCDVEDISVSDILYASVEDDDHKGPRTNTLYWNGVYSKSLVQLKDEIEQMCATGYVKDAEWRFENECRLFYQVPENYGDHIAVDLPLGFFNEISFVLSPWASEKERKDVQKQLKECFSRVGRTVVDDSSVLRQSKLENGLQKWAKERGLAGRH